MKRIISIIMVAGLMAAVVLATGDESLLDKAQKEYEHGNYKKCAKYYKEAIDSGMADMTTFYNAACCMAMTGDKENAFTCLDRAIDIGYKHSNWMAQDSDLVSLHDDPRWNEVYARCKKQYDAYLKTINMQLYLLFQADQSDRFNYREGQDWGEIARKDSLRQEKVARMIDDGQLKVSDDYYHAGMIFHHGRDSTAYKIAEWLANKALEMDSTSDNARWLIAATKDRYLWSINQPQWYGTQNHLLNGKWTLDPIDTTAVTDTDRAFHRIATLKQLRQSMKERNSHIATIEEEEDNDEVPEFLQED
jgi:tetratricopeptide (TPR) repeat protein